MAKTKKSDLPILSTLLRWVKASKLNLLVAAIAAAGMLAAVATFAAGPQYVHPTCDKKVTKWAYKLGWKDPRTFNCKPDFSRHTHDALPGSVAEAEFKNIRSEQDLARFLKSDNPKAALFRDAAKRVLSTKSYNAWESGKHFTMVQFEKPATIKGNSFLSGGRIEFNDTHERPVPAGDILFIFVDPTSGGVNANGNVRLDCGNVRIIKIFPKQPQKVGSLKIVKFNDKNGNGREDKDEKRLKGVSFRIPGVGTFKTDKKGTVTIKNLAPGNYKVIEKRKNKKLVGWLPVGSETKRVHVKNSGQAVVKFANREKRSKLKIVKFNDENGNGKEDKGEKRMKDVKFEIRRTVKAEADAVDAQRVEPENLTAVEASAANASRADLAGEEYPDPAEATATEADDPETLAGQDKPDDTVKTDKDGTAVIEDLKPGTYTVTEALSAEQAKEFEPSTKNPRTVTMKRMGTVTVKFGNRRVQASPTPTPTPTQPTITEVSPTPTATATPTPTPTPTPCIYVTPGSTATPTPTPEELCTPTPTPGPVETPTTTTQVKGSLPITGQSEWIALLTILLAAGVYGTGRYLQQRKSR